MFILLYMHTFYIHIRFFVYGQNTHMYYLYLYYLHYLIISKLHNLPKGV